MKAFLNDGESMINWDVWLKLSAERSMVHQALFVAFGPRPRVAALPSGSFPFAGAE
jgi:hypothetical protein